MPRGLPRGIYAITAPHDSPATLAQRVSGALAGGAAAIQYRDKSGDALQRRKCAALLATMCRHSGVPLIINDDVELAAEVSADGVHLGRDDGDPRWARRRLGRHAIIGVSCYNALDRANAAAEQGADYVAFGSCFPSPTKPSAVRAPIELITTAKNTIRVPVVAIGGITPENGRLLVRAGADMLAVISGIFGQPDIAAAARRYAALYEERETA